MGVWNSMRHDARVARSAGTLASAGACVVVVAASWQRSDWGVVRHELGFDVDTVPRRPPWALSVGEGGASVMGFMLRVFRAFPTQVRFMNRLWRAKADIYHAHDLQALPWVWLVAKLRGRPIIYEAHEISADRTSLKRLSGIIVRVEGFLARRCDAIIATTDMRADFFTERYAVPRPVVLQNRPHFIAIERTNRFRDALRIPDTSCVVLYQGGLQPGRGLPALVEQIPHVPDACFVFLGDGNLRDSLIARVNELNVSERVHFLDAVPWQDLASWTASADIGVQVIENTCLNHYTTDSNKLFEYAMAGLPVIASDFPEIRRIVAEYDFGELVDPADSGAVRAALRRLIMDDGLRTRYAQNAFRARQKLSWETQEPRLLALYAQLIDEK